MTEFARKNFTRCGTDKSSNYALVPFYLKYFYCHGFTSDFVPAVRVARQIIQPIMLDWAKQWENMKTAHNKHRAAHLQNHGMEPMQAAEDVKKEKAWIKDKKMLGIGVAMLAVMGIGLGIKFGLPFLE